METTDQIEITPRAASRRGFKHANNRCNRSLRNASRASDKNAIRPFHVNVPETELTELRRRIKATKWPERENGYRCIPMESTDLATIQSLARYWATEYDWRKIEAK